MDPNTGGEEEGVKRAVVVKVDVSAIANEFRACPRVDLLTFSLNSFVRSFARSLFRRH